VKNKKAQTTPAAFADIIPTTTDPRVFKKLEALCAIAIAASKNDPVVRAAIASLNIEMRTVAGERIGHDGIDNTVLSQLLKRTDPNKPMGHVPPAPMRDPIDVLELNGVLEPVHVSAARGMRDIWQAFGRCLTVSGRGYERSGGGVKRASALQPLDVMGEETWEFYKEVFTPWYNTVKNLTISKKTTGNVKAFDIIFRIVIDEYFPDAVDSFMQLESGTALRVMKTHLGRFFDAANGQFFTTDQNTSQRMVDDTDKVAVAA